MKHLLLFALIGFFIGTSSRAAEEESVCAVALSKTTRVPFRVLVSSAVSTGNIHDTVAHLENTYKDNNFRIPLGPIFGGRTVYILQDRALVARVMRERSRLVYVNRNFDLSHGHFFSINSVDTVDPLWADLHEGLWEIFKNKPIVPILEKHKQVLLGRNRFNLNETLEEFYMKVWAEYCFGPFEFTEFKRMRDRLIAVLGKVFHENRLNRVPFLGNITSRLNRLRNASELEYVDQELSKILHSSIENGNGAFAELFRRLEPRYPNALQITLDNSFLAVLVYDFIYVVMLHTLAHLAQNPDLDPQQQLKDSRHSSFLYPFRFRVVESDFDGFRKGDFVIVNLQQSGLYFSAGPRSCPGANLFGDIARWTLETIKPLNLQFEKSSDVIVISPNRDLPFMESSHRVHWGCPFAHETHETLEAHEIDKEPLQ